MIEKYSSDTITIEVVRGGYIITYPDARQPQGTAHSREVVSSTRSLHQRLKDIFEILNMQAH